MALEGSAGLSQVLEGSGRFWNALWTALEISGLSRMAVAGSREFPRTLEVSSQNAGELYMPSGPTLETIPGRSGRLWMSLDGSGKLWRAVTSLLATC